MVNPYKFVEALSEELSSREIIFVDTGCTLAWVMQNLKVKRNQRLFSDFNNTAMGYALPASIGACIGSGKRVVCICGDGGLQMNIQELGTIITNSLDIKIIVFDNKGYNMIRQTQDQWLNSKYEGCGVGQVATADYCEIAKGYGIRNMRISNDNQIRWGIRCGLYGNEAILISVSISPMERVKPQVKYGMRLDDERSML